MPFELGRPVGTPDEPAFQRRVIEAALDLLNRKSGPVLEDFPDDAPGGASGDFSGWVCPVNLAPPAAGSEVTGAEAVRAEVDQLRPWYQLGLEQRGRTTVGVSGLEVDAAVELLAGFLDDPATASPNPEMSVAQALKFASEDIKAWYLEAATARPGPSAAATLTDWFWRETAAGALMLRLASICRDSDNAGLKNLGEKSLVPRSHMSLVA